MAILMNNTNDIRTKVDDMTIECMHSVMDALGISKEADLLRMALKRYLSSPEVKVYLSKEQLQSINHK